MTDKYSDTIWLRDFSAADRKNLAKSGKAMPDGSFPIETEEDLHNAIRLAGNASNPAAAKAHIKSRAAAMGMSSAIPDSWKSTMKKAASDTLSMLRPAFKFSHDGETELTWVQAFPYGSWEHPVYGTIEITPQKAAQFKENFDNKVMKQEVPWTFEHGQDVSKGNKAAGTISEVEIRDDGLYAGLSLTPTALKELQDGEWLYVSPEYKDEWASQADGQTYSNVLWGGSFTNYPFLKGIAPINMSDLGTIVAEVADKEHSEPGTGIGGEPGPRTDYDRIAPAPPATPPNPDPSVKPPGAHVNNTGNLIFSEGGVNKVDEAELRKLLGVDDKVELSEHLKQIVADAEVMRLAAADADRAKKFSDAFPAEAKRLAELADRDRKSQAKEFAESFTRIKAGDDGQRTVRLTPNAITKVEEAALKFSDGSITVGDFGAVIEEIAKSGVVELGERGSSLAPDDDGIVDGTTAATRLADLAKVKVAESLKTDKPITLADATNQVALEHPDLFNAYRQGVGKQSRLASGAVR